LARSRADAALGSPRSIRGPYISEGQRWILERQDLDPLARIVHSRTGDAEATEVG